MVSIQLAYAPFHCTWTWPSLSPFLHLFWKRTHEDECHRCCSCHPSLKLTQNTDLDFVHSETREWWRNAYLILFDITSQHITPDCLCRFLCGIQGHSQRISRTKKNSNAADFKDLIWTLKYNVRSIVTDMNNKWTVAVCCCAIQSLCLLLTYFIVLLTVSYV